MSSTDVLQAMLFFLFYIAPLLTVVVLILLWRRLELGRLTEGEVRTLILFFPLLLFAVFFLSNMHNPLEYTAQIISITFLVVSLVFILFKIYKKRNRHAQRSEGQSEKI
jgi:Na+/proline symporter